MISTFSSFEFLLSNSSKEFFKRPKIFSVSFKISLGSLLELETNLANFSIKVIKRE